MNVPLALLNQVDEAALDWLVPGHGARQGGLDS